MLAPHIGQIYATVANASLSAEDAHEMIEAACKSAADQIRAECWRRWQAEQHDAKVRAERLEEQQWLAKETAAWRKQEAEISRRRTEQLMAAEQMPPQRKRTLWNG